MSEKKINLEEILNKELNILSISVEQIEKSALKAMKEACKQVLELAAENANLIEYNTNKTAFTAHNMGVNKQSIIDTINQVE